MVVGNFDRVDLIGMIIAKNNVESANVKDLLIFNYQGKRFIFLLRFYDLFFELRLLKIFNIIK